MKKEDFIRFVKNIDEKERDWESRVKNIDEKERDWESRHLTWVAGIVAYVSLLLLYLSIFYCVFIEHNLFHTDVTSARYMLSAMVQSQAAIVAIVVSLTVIAVQLTASAYSPRVIDVFQSVKKNSNFWILLGFYGFSIFYGLLLLKLVDGAEGDLVSQKVIWSLGLFSFSLETGVSFAYLLGAFTFVILFPYMWNILNLMKIETIINRLANDITKYNLLNPKEDPIQPIIDIVHGSIMKYDLETTRVGLKAVTEPVIKVIDSDNEKEISKRFCEHLARIRRLAMSKEDEDSAIEAVKNFGNFGKATAGKGLETATSHAVTSLEVVGIASARKGHGDAAREVVVSLREIGIAAAGKGLEKVTSHAIKSLEVVGRASANSLYGDATREVVVSLREVGMAAAKKSLEDVARDAAVFLESVGNVAIERGHGDAAFELIESLYALRQFFMEKELESARGVVIKALLAVKPNIEKMVASHLASSPHLSEEIVKTARQDFKIWLNEQDRDSFQKFMKIYKKKLGEV